MQGLSYGKILPRHVAVLQVSRGQDGLGLRRAAEAAQPTPAEPSGQPASAGEVRA